MAQGITQEEKLKVELFDLIEKQATLQADLNRLEQIKQNKLKDLSAIRQPQEGQE